MGQQGALLRSRYRLQDVIGKGRLAGVWRARDEELDRLVAVKILRPRYAADAAIVERFRQEATRAAPLTHPSIVDTYDYGVDGETAYLVMPLIEGLDLQAVIDRHGRLTVDHALRIARTVADALDAAHSRGVIHGDLKPSNVLLDADGDVRVVDFGLGRVLGEALPVPAGTPARDVRYLSPEQAAGERVGPRSDLYSLGLILHELLTGETPFEGDSAQAVAQARLHAGPPAPRSLASDLPKAIDKLVMRALAREPRRRYQSARTFREAIDRWWRTSRRTVAAPAVAPAVAPAAVPMGAQARPPRPWRFRELERAPLQPWVVRPAGREHRAQFLGALLPATAMLVVAAVGWSFGWSIGASSASPPVQEAVLDATATPLVRRSLIASRATPTPAPSPSAILVKATPSPTPEPTPVATPEPTPRPTPEPTVRPPRAPPVPPAPPSPEPTPTPVPPGQSIDELAPAESVVLFYDLVEEHRFEEAAALWSERMLSRYPPDRYLERRFGRTIQIDVHRAETVEFDPVNGLAVVAVDVTEHRDRGNSPVRYAGSWELVFVTDTWLLDEPHFRKVF
jgi:tRNA A-37 threonylcarbamoyl transferase component Bud32